MTDDFAAGFMARSVWLMPEILDNAKTFSKAVAVHLGNSEWVTRSGPCWPAPSAK